MVLNKAMLRLVTGEDVQYGFFDDWIEADTILMEIKDKPFIKVTDKKDRVLTIFPDKVIGCYIKKRRMF